MAPQSRPLNPLEQKVHQACVTQESKMLTQKEVDALIPDVNLRVAAINFLLNTGMLKLMQDDKKQISYKAVMKKEIEVKKEMGGDENMVLSHIQSSGNEGIWTKHLKAKTELHQTVINRCLKLLEQKGLVKVVKSVRNPTRKIYMMSHLEPSVEVTGGPWYSENELDTEFIKLLSNACLRFIQEKSYPKSSFSWDEGAQTASVAPLFPISQASSYPTSKQIHTWLQKTKLSEQELGVEHVEMLLDVLIFDGEIERLPAYGARLWDMGAMDIDSEDERREKKRKRKEDERKERWAKKVKSKKRSRKDETSEETSEEDARRKKRRKVKVEDESESSEGDQRKKKGKKGKKRKREYSDEDSNVESASDDDSEEDHRRAKRKRSSKPTGSRSKSKHRLRRSSPSESLPSESETSDLPSSPKTKKRKTAASSARSKNPSKPVFAADSEHEDSDRMVNIGSVSVYRAVRQERVSIGWAQAPCGRCPVFDFCSENGPVNPNECIYYGDWIRQGVVDF